MIFKPKVLTVAQEGLLVQEPYRGLRVADLDAATLLDIADVRVALDMQAVSAILADATGRRRRRLMAAWSDYERDAFASDPSSSMRRTLRFTAASGPPRRTRF